MGSRWCTPDHNLDTIHFEAFVPRRHLGLYLSITVLNFDLSDCLLGCLGRGLHTLSSNFLSIWQYCAFSPAVENVNLKILSSLKKSPAHHTLSSNFYMIGSQGCCLSIAFLLFSEKMHHSFGCLREVTCVSYTSNNWRHIFWGAAKFKRENKTTPRTTAFSVFPVHVPSANGLYYSPSLTADFHVQMSKQVICSCPLPCENRDRVTLF